MDCDACSSCTVVTNSTSDSFEDQSEILKPCVMEPFKVTRLISCSDDNMESPLIPVQKNLKQRFSLSAIAMNEDDCNKQRIWSQTEDSMSGSEDSVPLIPVMSSGEAVTTVPSRVHVAEQNLDETEIESQSLLPQFSTSVAKMTHRDESQNTQEPTYDQRKNSVLTLQPNFKQSQMSCFSFLQQPSDSQIFATPFSTVSKQKSQENIGIPSSGSTIIESLDIYHQDQQTQEREQKIVARILKLHSELASAIENSKECPDSSTTGRMRKRLTCINDILIKLKEWHKSELEQLSRDVRTSHKSLDERFRLRTSIQNLRQRQKIVLELFYKQKQLSLALKSTNDGDNLTSSDTSKDSTKLENIKGEAALSQAFRSDDDAGRLQPLHYTDTCMKISKPSKVANEDASTICGSEFSYKRGEISQMDFSVVGTNAQSLTTVSNTSLNQSWSGITNERCANYHNQYLGHKSKHETSVEVDISICSQSNNKISSKTVVNVKDKDPVCFKQTAGVKRKVPSESLENLFSKRTKNAEKSALDDPAGGKFTNGTPQIDKNLRKVELHISAKEQEDDNDLNCFGQNISENGIVTATRGDDKKQDDVKGDDKLSEHGVGMPIRGVDKQDDVRGDSELGSITRNQNDVAVKSGNKFGSHFLLPQRSKMLLSPVLADSSAKNASISPSGTSMSSDVFVVKAKELQRRIDKKIEMARLSQIQGQKSNLESLGVKDSTTNENPSAAAGVLQHEEEDEDDFHDDRLNSMFRSFDWPDLDTSAVQGDTVQPRYKEQDLWLSKNSTTFGVMPAPKPGLRKMCPSLKTLISAQKLMPGKDNLTLTAKGKTEIASLTSKGLIENGDGVVFSTPVQWLSSALGGAKVSRKRAYQEVYYNGQQLFVICQEKNQNIHGSSGFALKSDSSAKMSISCDGKYSQAFKSSSSTTVANSTTASNREFQDSAVLPSSIINTQPELKSMPLSRPGMIKQTYQLNPVNTRRDAPQTRGFLSSNITVQDTMIPKSNPVKGNYNSLSPRKTTLMTSSSVNAVVTSTKTRPSMEADAILATQKGSEPQISAWVDDDRQQKSGINNQTLPAVISEDNDKDDNVAIAKASQTTMVDDTTCSASRSDSNVMNTTRSEEEFLAGLLYQCKVKLIDNRELINDTDLPENFWTTDYAKLKIGQSLWASVDVWN